MQNQAVIEIRKIMENALLDRKSLGGPWVSEVYQLLGVLIGLCWIALIERPVLTSTVWIYGSCILKNL